MDSGWQHSWHILSNKDLTLEEGGAGWWIGSGGVHAILKRGCKRNAQKVEGKKKKNSPPNCTSQEVLPQHPHMQKRFDNYAGTTECLEHEQLARSHRGESSDLPNVVGNY